VKVELKKVPYVRGDAEWLRARCGKALPDKKEVVAYLSQGRTLKAMSMVEQYLLGTGFVDDALSVRTDGTWAWTSTTAFYVAKHDLELPPEFLAHVRERKFRMPSKAELERMELTIPRDDSDY